MRVRVRIVKNLRRVALGLLRRCGICLSDKVFLQLQYYLYMGKKLNLKCPATFQEKLQWLKLYNRRPEYTNMVDKYEAKKYAASLIGEEFVIPTFGVWNNFDEIDFSQLPNQFVLKTTNGGGSSGIIICKDKATLDVSYARKVLNNSLRSDIYRAFKEWPYKNIHPRIIAEKYMVDESGELRDFKFTCTNGVAHNVMLCMDRYSGDTKFYFFDKSWNLLRLNKRGREAPTDFTVPKPRNIEQMFEIAAKLSEKLPYARIDLYNVNGKIYFGEITFFPQSGYDSNLLPEAEFEFGNLVKLPSKYVQQ